MLPVNEINEVKSDGSTPLGFRGIESVFDAYFCFL